MSKLVTAREYLARAYDDEFPRIAASIRQGHVDTVLGMDRVLPAIDAAIADTEARIVEWLRERGRDIDSPFYADNCDGIADAIRNHQHRPD